MRKLLPIIVERDEDDMYVVECPLLSGCYTQGKTLDAALRNIQEVIELVREEPENRAILKDYEKVALHRGDETRDAVAFGPATVHQQAPILAGSSETYSAPSRRGSVSALSLNPVCWLSNGLAPNPDPI